MAQAAHAANLVATTKDIRSYKNAKQRTVIVLEGTGSQIENLAKYLYDRGIRSEYVIDEGVNEIETMAITALATEQMNISDDENRKLLRGFKLYKHGVFQG